MGSKLDTIIKWNSKMFYEKLNITFDIEKLRQAITEYVLPLGNAEYNYQFFGGWSLQSRTGDWRDGWQYDPTNILKYNGLITDDMIPKAQKFLDISDSFEYSKPTAAQQGYLLEVITKLDELGLYPRRARVSQVRANSQSIRHIDGLPHDYLARVHIPVWTNEQCIHSCDGIDLHMPADGSAYMMWVNRAHQVFNRSTEDRFHIIMDAYDTAGITKQFKYNKPIQDLFTRAEAFREKMNKVELTSKEIDYLIQAKRNLEIKLLT